LGLRKSIKTGQVGVPGGKKRYDDVGKTYDEKDGAWQTATTDAHIPGIKEC